MTPERATAASPRSTGTGALTRWRVMAWIVGTMLLVLVFVAMPLRYLGGQPEFSENFSPIHGFVYIVYLVATFLLSQQLRWSLRRTVLVMLAGTVPFLSFVVERRVGHAAQRQLAGTIR